MKRMPFNLLVAFAVLLWGIFTISCSSLVSGGVTLPNGMAGYVIDKYGMPVEGAIVIAQMIIITPLGEEIVSRYQTTTNADGRYFFNSVAQGDYIVTINYRNRYHLIPLVAVTENDTVDIGGAVLEHPTVIVMGRVLGGGNLMVKIPGMNYTAIVDENGFYHLPNVPPQELRLAFISANSVNYLHINITPHDDTVFLRDIAFAETIAQARGYDTFYPTTLENSFAVIPVEYNIDSIPEWYAQRDFSRAEYITLRNASFTFLPTSGNWNNPANWSLERVPRRGDTAIISNSICIIDIDSILPITYVSSGAEIIINHNSYFESFSLANSTIRVEQENVYIWLQGNFILSDTTEIRVNFGSLAVFNGVVGAGVVHTGWRGDVQIDGERAAIDFEGVWIVEAGKLRLRMANSIGRSEINILPNATLDIETNWALNRARIIRIFTQDSIVGSLELDASPVIPIMEIDGERLAAGDYSRDNLPEFIRGSGIITVSE